MDTIVRDEFKCEMESFSSPAKKPRNEEGVTIVPPTPPPPSSYSSSGRGGGETKTIDPRSIIQVYQYDPADEEYYLDIDQDGIHDMTAKERSEYCRQIKESEGFDVMDFPLSFGCGKITPIIDPDEDKVLKASSELALKEYNEKENTKLEFVKVVKANIGGGSCGIDYYITFDVKDADADADADAVDGPTTFQALVTFGIHKNEVRLCRPKKSN